jgi:hypothetical protein
MAWVALLFLLLYGQVDPSWMFLIISLWVAVRLLLFRRRCMDEGMWRVDERVSAPLPGEPARESVLGTTRDARRWDWRTVEKRRVISAILAIGFVAYAESLTPPGLWIVAVFYMLAPMSAIWFGDLFEGDIAEIIGFERYAFLLQILGWLALCLTPVVVYLYKWRLELWRQAGP